MKEMIHLQKCYRDKIQQYNECCDSIKSAGDQGTEGEHMSLTVSNLIPVIHSEIGGKKHSLCCLGSNCNEWCLFLFNSGTHEYVEMSRTLVRPEKSNKKAAKHLFKSFILSPLCGLSRKTKASRIDV